MHLRTSSLSAVLFFLLAPAPEASEPPTTPPNVLILLADDLGVDMLSSYGLGSDLPVTPNLDRLAQRGVSFDNAWANPVCSSTRACLLTGRYSFRTGGGYVVTKRWSLPLEEETLPEALDRVQSGYAHGAFGKWHLGGIGGASAPNLAGFNHYSGARPNLWSYFQWKHTRNGEVFPETGYATTNTVKTAAAWIRETPGPWLAYVAFHAPHAPYHKPPDTLYSENLTGVGSPTVNPRPYYKAMIEAMDKSIGSLLFSLGPQIFNTTVIFVGDNGTPSAVTVPPFSPAHAKATTFQGGVQVPLIVAGPQVAQPGSRCSALVSVVDIFDTTLEIAGAQPEPGATDSVSLMPYLADPSQPSIRQEAFAELFKPSGPGPYSNVQRALRNGRYKLIVSEPSLATPELQTAPAFPPRPYELLFDLTLDPFEKNNLLEKNLTQQEEAAYKNLRRSLRELLHY